MFCTECDRCIKYGVGILKVACCVCIGCMGGTVLYIQGAWVVLYCTYRVHGWYCTVHTGCMGGTVLYIQGAWVVLYCTYRVHGWYCTVLYIQGAWVVLYCMYVAHSRCVDGVAALVTGGGDDVRR